MQFRLDINGLRAIAVLAVLLFHFKIPGFKGGFIGVDVFFVISGFLMTRIIVGRIEKGNFGVLDFYRARAVRIVPALLAMCLFVLGWAWFYLMPQDYELLAKHALGSVTFLSNIAYWSEASYFAETAYGKWLLHTWSLSLEWQFYLLYPLLIAALVKLFKSNMRALRMWICLLFVISLACSILMTPRSSSAAFFLLPSRAWEMLAGGLVCLYPLQLKPRWKLPVEVTGILLIGASIALFHPNHAWPGWRALGPVVGCVLVLAAASQRSLLASMPFQWLGNLSYSVYLWHWPVVVALRGNFPVRRCRLAVIPICQTADTTCDAAKSIGFESAQRYRPGADCRHLCRVSPRRRGNGLRKRELHAFATRSAAAHQPDERRHPRTNAGRVLLLDVRVK